eukprot:TRINITY_DN944_c0_g1_i1.p1 TRINITY_DN944_c0_g1~~TRINITY_DN944_c0_g1_i1.p1  ORF type:complete len:230 (-),score=38.41 TRINITY_DN944_c0_g1_i1:276-965(-)
MIRTRDIFENAPTLPSPNLDTKRVRIATPEPSLSDTNATIYQHHEDILHRCLTFLHHTQDQSRPKTLERLYRAVEQICTFEYAVDPNVIYFHLVLNQILIPHDVSGVNFVSVNTTPPSRPPNQFVIVVPTDSASTTRVSNDFKEVLKKSVSWVQNNRGLRGKQVGVESFVKSLSQICVVKKTAAPTLIVEQMVSRGWVTLMEDGMSVVYHLNSDERQLLESHYMPVLCK